MAEKQKNLCAMIPAALHSRVRAAQEESGLTLSAYITQLLTDYYEKGSEQIVSGVRTMAFQMPEKLFQRLKRHLEQESRRTGKKVSQDVLCKGWINHLIHCDCGSFVVICSVIARKGEKNQQLSQKCYQKGNIGEPPCLQLHKLEAWGPFIFQNPFSDEPAFCR